MCNKQQSHTLCKEDGFNSAFVIAHETGHVLGMEHDGQGNVCKEAPQMGSIMAPLVESNYKRYFWSRCSRSYLTNQVEQYSCLNDNPWQKPETSSQKPWKTTERSYSLDEQCRFDFGEGYSVCKNIQDQCTTLWCSTPANPQFCKTKRQPPLDGTRCRGPSPNRDYVCFKGSCVQHTRDPSSIVDGNWGAWSAYSDCSVTCGIGERHRTRQCTNPAPKNGGRACQGNAVDYQPCYSTSCVLGADPRYKQCNLYGKKNGIRDLKAWPSPSNSQCSSLRCYSESREQEMTVNMPVPFGAYCSYDDPHSICLFNQCRQIGCDKVLGSSKRYNECGICGGTSNDCEPVNFNKKKTAKLNNRMLRVYRIPAGAYNIKITDTKSAVHFLAIKNHRTKTFVFGKQHFNDITKDRSRQCVDANTLWKHEFQTRYHPESITAVGPTAYPYDVLAWLRAKNESILVNIQYWTKKSNSPRPTPKPSPRPSRKGKFIWKKYGLEPCSVTCGAGFQQQKYQCVKMTKRGRGRGRVRYIPTSTRSCRQEMPQERFACSIPCPKWQTGEWSACSVSCRQDQYAHGIKTRQVTCELTEKNGNRVTKTNDKCDAHSKPEETDECFPEICPKEWQVGSWSSCQCDNGEDCGCTGIQKRQATCDPPGMCTKRPPVTEQTCEAGPCDVSSDSNCEDKTVFCDVPALVKYCDSAKFRDLCCKSCSSITGRAAKRNNWESGQWGECTFEPEAGECFQRRQVLCPQPFSVTLRTSPLKFKAGQQADTSLCKNSNRPNDRQPCVCP